MHLKLLLALGALAFAGACIPRDDPPAPSLAAFLPTLPPTGGAALSAAGLVTDANRARELPVGDAAKGRVGDYFLRNDQIQVLIQAPGRFGEILGFGGNPINLAFVGPGGGPGRTQMGEISAFLNGSHTVNFTRVEVVRDGSAGGPAVVRAWGHAAVLDYFNLAGFVGGLGIVGFDVNVPPPLDIVATYLLSPGDKHLRVVYTLWNRTETTLPVAIGSFCDSGGEVSFFTPGEGYGEAQSSDLVGVLTAAKPIDYYAAQSPENAYGVLPAFPGSPAPLSNTAVFLKGQGVMLYDAPTLLIGLSQTRFVIDPHAARSYETYLLMGEDVGDVHGQVLALHGEPTGEVRGRVTVLATSTPIAAARIAVLASDGRVVTTYTSRGDGSFGGRLSPGRYTLVADKEGWPRSEAAPVSVTVQSLATRNLSLPQTARVSYRIVDEAERPLAARLSFLGATATPPSALFRDVTSDGNAPGVSRVAYTWRGDSERDGVLEVEPGTYRVVVSHGSEYTLYDQRLTFTAGSTFPLQVKLVRVVDSPGYVKGDFHQHGVNSPDATTPMKERIITYLAAGVEFVGSSDHDYLTDYGPLASAMGVGDKLATMVGVESTPFDYGHFNAFPLPIRTDMPNQGAPDWGDGESTNLSPGRLFSAFRQAGAEVVQVNHPRESGARRSPIAGFQAYFDRAALSFDLQAGTYQGDRSTQPVPNEGLRIAPDEPLWSDDFDTLEIYNGFSLRQDTVAGQLVDERVDLILRDWFNLLSSGKLVAALGNTDSHGRNGDAVEAPFNYVRVPDDSRPGAVRQEDILGAMQSGDITVSNGPFVTLHLQGSPTPSMGRLVPTDRDSVRVTVKVQAPTWMHLDEVKLFSNNRYRVPPPGPDHDPIAPRLRIRLSETPGPGEALLRRVTVAPGAQRWEAEVEVPDFPLPDAGRDAWIVAEVRGSRGMYPYLGAGVSRATPLSELMSPSFSGGIFPLALTNPAFVDRNGNGRFDAPLRR